MSAELGPILGGVLDEEQKEAFNNAGTMELLLAVTVLLKFLESVKAIQSAYGEEAAIRFCNLIGAGVTCGLSGFKDGDNE